jgi:hypothetical protein
MKHSLVRLLLVSRDDVEYHIERLGLVVELVLKDLGDVDVVLHTRKLKSFDDEELKAGEDQRGATKTIEEERRTIWM